VLWNYDLCGFFFIDQPSHFIFNQIYRDSYHVSVGDRRPSGSEKSIQAYVSISRIVGNVILVPGVNIAKNGLCAYSLIQVTISNPYLSDSEVGDCAFGDGEVAYKIMERTVADFNDSEAVITQMRVEMIAVGVAGMLKTLKLFILSFKL
jgi:hypothetical protein